MCSICREWRRYIWRFKRKHFHLAQRFDLKILFLKCNFHYIKQVPNMCFCTLLLLSTRLKKPYQQEITEYLKLLRESMKVGFSLCVWWRMAPCSLEGERTGRSFSLTAPTPRPGSRQRWLWMSDELNPSFLTRHTKIHAAYHYKFDSVNEKYFQFYCLSVRLSCNYYSSWKCVSYKTVININVPAICIVQLPRVLIYITGMA